MATQKISEMTEAIILQDEDYAPIVQSNLNKKIKIEFFRDYNKLHNKPTLNSVTIEGDKKIADYNIVKDNQGIKVDNETRQTLELEVPSSLEMEQRANVNKAITIATADKMSKETAHQTMSKEYQPNSQDKLKEGENQPVSYKAVKDYVDVLENKVDTNEEDIENKYTNLSNNKLDKTGNASNVTNTFTQASTLATLTSGEKLSVSLGKIMKAITDLISHIGNKSNPHTVTKAQVGLGNVDNTSDVNKPISTAVQAALNGKAPTSHTHTKTQITDFPTKVSQFENDAKYQTDTQVEEAITVAIGDLDIDGLAVADTLPIGSVIGWDSEEPYPTDIYEEVDYNPKQLLVNPDFQVNQRGETTYNGINTKNTYTVDMWRTVTTLATITSKVEVTPNGIKFSCVGTGGANFEQILDLSNNNGYVSIVKISNLTGRGVFSISNSDSTWNEKELENDINIVYVPVGKIPKRILIRLYDTSSVEIEYINLFEGDIAYPHVKKKYAYDLMECREIIRAYELTIIDYSFINQNILYYIIPNGLGVGATLSIITFDVLNQGMTGQNFTFNQIAQTYKDTFTIGAYKANHGVVNDGIKYPLFIKYIVSKEPL